MNTKKGKLFVIEGVDGSGKTTQFRALLKRMEDSGHTVKTIHFPRHQQPFFGELVDEYLNGVFGDPAKIHPRLASLLYACDRWEVKDLMWDWLNQGNDILLDRYMTSNKGHQLGKLPTDEEKRKYLTWIDRLEFEIFQIPKPDKVFYLHLPLEHILKMMSNRGSENKEYITSGLVDGLEKDHNHLQKAQEGYAFTAQHDSTWKRIDCVQDGKLLSVDEIHSLIWEQIKNIQ